jgi:hypothetical protein
MAAARLPMVGDGDILEYHRALTLGCLCASMT